METCIFIRDGKSDKHTMGFTILGIYIALAILCTKGTNKTEILYLITMSQ